MTILSRAVVFLFFFIWLLQMGATAAEKIDINSAPLDDLLKIIHIGEARARELISLRPFSSLDDLVRIKGIGETKVEDIKNEGLAWVEIKVKEDKSSFSDSLIEERSQSIVYPSGIIINEILPSPLGPDETEEWAEIFNQNDHGVDLSDWKITDNVGKTTTYTFPQGTKISPRGFLVLSRPITKITLNNDGDGLNLIQPDGKIIDSISYEKALRGQSHNRAESDWVWSSSLTPSSTNIIPTSISKTKEAEFPKGEAEELTPKKEIPELKPKRELAAIGEQVPQETPSFPPLFIALVLAIFSGVIIFFLKKEGPEY